MHEPDTPRQAQDLTCNLARRDHYRSAHGIYLGTASTNDDALDTAPGNLFGHLSPNLVEHDTLPVGCHTTLIKLRLRGVNDGEGRPQLGVQAQGLRARQVQESFCAIAFR